MNWFIAFVIRFIVFSILASMVVPKADDLVVTWLGIILSALWTIANYMESIK